MSHYHLRKENNCLNCDSEVQGRFCHVCGQENIEPKETFWHLVTHFVYDITHFDGKFFSSVKYLLTKPGFLSKEYIRGRRASYLNPIKMYVFISAFFFLFFFSIFKSSHETKSGEKEEKQNTGSYQKVRAGIEKEIGKIQKELDDPKTSQVEKQILINQLPLLQNELERIGKDTNDLKDLNYNKLNRPHIDYNSIKSYDSAQLRLPIEKRDSRILRVFTKRGIELEGRYGTDWSEILKMVGEKWLHSFPQLLFVSLPLFALMLRLLYVRRKNFYYVDHVIYAVHLYCAMFILMFLLFAIDKLKDFSYFGWLSFLNFPLFLYIVWYQYKSLKNFFTQSRRKTIFKFLLLVLMALFVMVILFAIGFLIFAFTV